MKKLILLAVFVLSGCYSSADALDHWNPDSKYQVVSCVGQYEMKSHGSAGDYGVTITMVQQNRVGHVFVRPLRMPNELRFAGTWVRASDFKSFSCTSEGQAEDLIEAIK